MLPKNPQESLQNIESISGISSRTRASTCDLGCEETPHLGHLNSPTETNINSSPTLDNSNLRKPFQYKKGPLIGKGSYGEVNECLNLSSGEIIASKSVKVYGDLARLGNYVEALKKEIVILKNLAHPNVVKYFAIETSEVKEENYSQIEIISEYVSGGSIKVLLEKFDKLDERVVSSYTKQILEGLAYLHANEIVHRNIKSSNVLIDAYGTAKLTDFGCFKNLDKFVSLNSPDKAPASPCLKTAACWEAPEVVMKKSQGKPSDIWSVGCVVLEMLTGLMPWRNLTANLDNVCKLITSGTPPPFPDHISNNCKDFLFQVFKFRPEERPTAEELLEHPFIREQLPSLSCLDFDPQGHPIYQPSLIMGSIDFLQDEILRENGQGGSIDNFMNVKNPAELSIYLGQSQANQFATPFTSSQAFIRSDSKQDQKVESLQTLQDITNAVDQDKIQSEKIKQSCHFDVKENPFRNSPNLKAGKENHVEMQTPIKNTYFSFSNSTIQRNNQRKPSNIIPESPPLSKEELRQKFEEQMREELACADEEEYKEEQEEKEEDLDAEELRKLELRRQFEQEMERELMNVGDDQTE